MNKHTYTKTLNSYYIRSSGIFLVKMPHRSFKYSFIGTHSYWPDKSLLL